MSLSSQAEAIFKLIDDLEPLIRSTPIASVLPFVEAARVLLQGVDAIRETLSESDAAVLEAKLDALEPLVLARAREVADRLRG